MNEPSTKQLDVDGATIVIDWLMYRSYEFNRTRSPEIDPKRWRSLYYNAETYEKIYQRKNHESHE